MSLRISSSLSFHFRWRRRDCIACGGTAPRPVRSRNGWSRTDEPLVVVVEAKAMEQKLPEKNKRRRRRCHCWLCVGLSESSNVQSSMWLLLQFHHHFSHELERDTDNGAQRAGSQLLKSIRVGSSQFFWDWVLGSVNLEAHFVAW